MFVFPFNGCASNGVEARSLYPIDSTFKHFRIGLDRNVYKSGKWTRADYAARTDNGSQA